ncbi:MAG: HDOD domain-containing protein [Deltaproteobacteria bacterium]|nr:HDOD domain-containing protein [Deltaproteobacteria bacterium]
MESLIRTQRKGAYSAGSGKPAQHVPAGNAVIVDFDKKMLVAHLGSCVGVALCDRAADVGGLLHLLLPEPPHSGPPDMPYRYAATGLPLFIEALDKAGADKNRLEAWVAGGAFPGPATGQDMELNIGGRNGQAVQEILLKHKVLLRQLEAGGYFGCRMTLDPWKWGVSIDPLWSGVPGTKDPIERPEPIDVDKAIQQVRPIPQVALKIIKMLRDDRIGFDEIAGEIRKDQTIAATLLKLCNSAFLGRNWHVDSVDHALVILGEKHLLRIAFSAASEMFFSQAGGGYALSMGGLYQHALGTALVAEELAKFTGKCKPDTAYTAGLLHDIGKVVLDQAVSRRKPFFYRTIQMIGRPMIEVEYQELGLRHTDTGDMLATRWGLHENLRDVIKHHHEPEQTQHDLFLVHIINIADFIMICFKVGLEMDSMKTDKLARRLRKVGIAPSSLPHLLDKLSEAFFNAFLPQSSLPHAFPGQ